ncbi:MAG: hypothetical protein QQN63_08210 [Nitrosopumilus sp.]
MWLAQSTSVIGVPVGVFIAAAIVILGTVVAQVVSGIRARKSHGEIDAIYNLMISLDPLLREAAMSTQRLDDVHLGPNAMDEDGAPKWYVRRSLEDAMHSLDRTIEEFGKAMATTFTQLDRTLDGMYREMKALREEVHSLKSV